MDGRVVIEAWLADLTFPGYLDRLYRLAAEFERAHPEYRVVIRGADFRSLPEEIARAAADGNPPAIAEYYSYMTPVARDSVTPDGAPLFTSIEKAIAGRDTILGEPVVVNDLVPALRQFYSYRGELLSMPVVATTMLLYANRTLLDAAGVDRLPQSWDELDAACWAVRRLPGGPAHAVTWANHGFFFQQAVAVQGGTLADADEGHSGRSITVDLTSTEMMAWIGWWRQLHRTGHYLYTGKIPDWAGNLRAFAEQRVAFRLASSNDVNYMVQAARQAGFDIEVGRFPYRDGVAYGGSIIAGTSVWLRAGLDQAVEDGALAFLQYLNSPRNAAEQHRLNSFVPATRPAFELLEKEGWFHEHPYHRAASDQLNSYPPGRTAGAGGAPPARGALFGDYAGVQDVMTLAMDDVLVRDADPAERFARANADAQRLLDAYHADRVDKGPRRPHSLRMEYFTGAEEYSGATLEKVVRLER